MDSVKSDAKKAAEAIATLIKGTAKTNAYGQSFTLGKRAYVTARPKGMKWSNIFRVAPPPLRFEDSKQQEAFARDSARAAGADVLVIDYSDTANAASVVRFKRDGKAIRDAGWDHDTLQEMVNALGNKAPAWATKQFAKTGEDDPTSEDLLVQRAQVEQFVVAAFGLDCEPGRKIEIDFMGCSAGTFDGVAYVTTD